MLIGEVARQSGVSAHTIRFYEAERLLTNPSRASSGYRVYSSRVLDELRFIEQAQRLGFTLGETREILSLGRSGRMPCERVAALCETHLKDIDRRMAELRAFRRNLRNAQHLASEACGFTADGFCRAVIGASRKKRP
jgi:MerR family copper efflux transcriptional regulator